MQKTTKKIKRDGEKLHELEKLFNFSWDLLGVGNLNGYFIKINSSFSHILGFSQEDIYKVPFLEFVHPEDFTDTAKALANAQKGQKKIFIANRYRCKDGSYKWIDWRVFVDKEEDRFFAVGRDITNSTQVEKSLAESQALLKSITTTTTDLIFCKDINRGYTFVNRAMEDLLECDEDDLLGKTPEEIFGPEAGAIIRRVNDITFRGQKTSEILHLYINGEEHFFHTVQVPMYVKDGKVMSINGIVRDVTEHVQTMEELKQYRNNLEELVNERSAELKKKTINLEAANIALKVLLEKRERDQKEIESNFLNKVEKLITPYLEQLKTKKSRSTIKTLVEIIELNINDIISPYALEFSNTLAKLTKTETKIVDLIRLGKSTRAIASLLDLSPTTVATHRQNIRKKLKLTNQKINLQSFLKTN